MNPRELEIAYKQNKAAFHTFIEGVKKNAPWDIYTIINPTLTKNPYASDFPLSFFLKKFESSSKTVNFLKSIGRYYAKNAYLYFSYLITFVLYKIYFKKSRKDEPKIVIDVFGLVDKTNESGEFSENYLSGIYEIFERFNTQYCILLRPYGIGKNPFKMVKFFRVIHKEKRDFMFEYEFLKWSDFALLFPLIALYPFKTLRLVQDEKTLEDKIFNSALLEDIKHFSFDSLTRYVLGKNISSITSIKKIYSWSEFQVIERGFNFGIRKHSNTIKLIACQFYLNYETYFNAYVDDLDYEMLSSPHEVLVNGKYYVQERKKVKYATGVSLRYKSIFDFTGVQEEKNILLLGSYIEKDTKYMLEGVKQFESVIFKNHPAVDIKKFGILPKNVTVSNENIYKLFENAKLVIGTASGTSLEALACGISVIIIASHDNLTANPLVEHGQGKIWDIVFDVSEMDEVYKKLIDFRVNNLGEIKEIAKWYKDNFFVEPTEENIIKVFELQEEN